MSRRGTKMSIKEQKLFFTRNGEYTIWEMVENLEMNHLTELKSIIFKKKWLETLPPSRKYYPNYIYKAYQTINDEQKKELLQEINKRFEQSGMSKIDFNAYIYYSLGKLYEMSDIQEKLDVLKSDASSFEIEGLEINYFLREREGHVKFIDVRFSSNKTTLFQGAEFIQKLNTEIRVYLELNTSLITNYSDYTHSENEKKNFINKLLKCIYQGVNEVSPIVLSDQSLRNLLLMDNSHLPSRLKFEVEGRLKVDVDINHSLSFLETIYQDEIKFFYHKYPISVLKVKITEGREEKYLIIDGPKGKMMSRSQNIEVQDIDDFVNNLSKLFRYDFLNHTYENEVKLLARKRISGGTINQKNVIVTTSYKEVEKIFSTALEDQSGIFIKVLRNAFFYCLKEKKALQKKALKEEYLSKKTTRYLSRIFEVSEEEITGLLSLLIESYLDNQNLDKLMEVLNEVVNEVRMIENASGL
jgi:hypothetical protein